MQMWARLVTCSAHGWPRAFESAETFASKRDVLLAARQRLRLEKLPPLLLPQGGVDGFQEVLLTVWRAAGWKSQKHGWDMEGAEPASDLHSFVLPAAQLEGSLRSSLSFWSRVNNLTQRRTLGVWEEPGENDDIYIIKSALLIAPIDSCLFVRESDKMVIKWSTKNSVRWRWSSMQIHLLSTKDI